MNYIYLSIIAASIATSLFSLAGALILVLSKKFVHKMIIFLVSLSAGTLLGDSFFHLLPEAAEKNNFLMWPAVILGILLFFVLEKVVHWRHCHMEAGHDHPHPVGIMNLVGDGLHNFIDGLVIGASFLVSWPLGIATTLAVITHEIPQELGDFATLLYAGYKAKKALLLNLLSGLASVLGAVVAIFIGVRSESFLDLILPLTAGGFIYIATSDLIPEMKKDSTARAGLKQLAGIVLGLAIMLLMRVVME